MDQKLPSGGAPQVTSATLVAGAAVFAGASVQQLFMKSKREEIPRQNSTISLITAVLASAQDLVVEEQGAKLQLFPEQSFISLQLGQKAGLGSKGKQLPHLLSHSFSVGTDCLFLRGKKGNEVQNDGNRGCTI
ncbi:hypothetical protein P7K49_001618 [Saguinus oedipus]|uniref:Uncharacterized protein n=1 Tax=Saguinus oedipus TaxID=9490 RepID=A0ABQ9WIW0_SAGOE|nr:hypothetical protein P7K49_001618 [Saguinus oedipus]